MSLMLSMNGFVSSSFQEQQDTKSGLAPSKSNPTHTLYVQLTVQEAQI